MLLPPSDRGRYLAMYMAIEMQIKMRYYWHITGLAKVLKFDDTQYDLKECKLVNNLVIPIKITFDQVISLLEAYCRTSLVAQRLKRLPGMQETWVWSLGWEEPLEKEMATHSSTLTWRIPWREEPGRLQSMGSQRVRHDWATSLSLPVSFLSIGKAWLV